MAAAVKAEEIGIYVNDVLVMCAQSASLSVDREMLDAVCAGTGAWRSQSPGIMSWEGSIDALWRRILTAEAATNVDAKNAFDMLVAGDTVEIRFGYIDGTPSDNNGYQFSGNAYITHVDLNYDPSDTQSWTIDFQGDGPLTRISVPV